MDWERIQRNFERRGFAVHLCADEAAVKQVISQHILPGKVSAVGFGNSETCRALSLIPFATRLADRVFIHDPRNFSPEDDRRALLADVYFTSANGLSAEGHIVNIDGTGNRVAATCFGPEHVVYVAGQNKIRPTLDDAMERARETAVKNARRYSRSTPCTHTGKCEDCHSPDCICGVMTIHRHALVGNRISILLVQQDLGM